MRFSLVLTLTAAFLITTRDAKPFRHVSWDYEEYFSDCMGYWGDVGYCCYVASDSDWYC